MSELEMEIEERKQMNFTVSEVSTLHDLRLKRASISVEEVR